GPASGVAGGRGGDLARRAAHEAKRNAVERRAVREQRVSSSSGPSFARSAKDIGDRAPRTREGPPARLVPKQ
ncbi:MAG: hypothetical protein U1E89_24105, partial [Burkholderiaceae bacterium]